MALYDGSDIPRVGTFTGPARDELSPVSYKYPWAIHPVENWVIEELNKRSNEKDMNPTTAGNTRTYSGPKTAWARVFSNAISTLAFKGAAGFVLGGVNGFDNSYGFNTKNEETIGYDAEGKPHKLNANGYSRSYVSQNLREANRDLPFRPPPNVLSIESSVSAGINDSFANTCKRTTIKWRCYSLAQLEYLTPYFLSPRVSVVIEWGWNHYDKKSLIDLTDLDWLYGAFQGEWIRTGKMVKDSGGNYEMAMGIITEYDININADGGYDCTTVVSNTNVIVEGEALESSVSREMVDILRNEGVSAEEADVAARAIGASRQSRKAITVSDPLKTFVEFVNEDLSLLANQGVVGMKGGKATATAEEKRIISKFNLDKTKRIFSPPEIDDGQGPSFYMRMDLVVDIINSFYSLKLLAGEHMHESKVDISKIDIKDVPICAHPALKSCDRYIILPNKVAPRFVMKEEKSTAKAPSLSELSGEYSKLFPTAVTQLNDARVGIFDNTYDDLYKIVNPDGNPFPMLKNYELPSGLEINNAYYPRKGYWGYLQDIFVSAELVQQLAATHDTILRLMEALLRKISEAMCNIPELKIISSPNSNTQYTIVDHNFTPVKYNKNAESLPQIPLFSNNAASIQNVSLSTKMSPEMVRQMMVVNSTKKATIPPKGYGTFTTDLKILQQSKYLDGDRLFSCAVIPKENVIQSNRSANRNEIHRSSKSSRKYAPEDTTSNSTFYNIKLRTGRGNEYYYPILAERSKDFLKSVIMDPYDEYPTYTNNPLIPGSTYTMELLGIGGFSMFSQFTLAHVSDVFNYERCVWQVVGIRHVIDNNVWKTMITAQARPIQPVMSNRDR